MRHVLALLLGVFACSTSVILIKASGTHPAVLASLRLLLAAVLLSPVASRAWRRHRDTFGAAQLRRTTVPALVLSVHFLSWTVGARLTGSAQATLIVNLAPLAIPFFLHWLARENINRAEIIGTVLALVGLVVLTMRDLQAGTGDALGNAVCFGSMLLFAWYLALGRRNRDFPSLWLYVVPVYAQAGVVCLLCSLPWIGGFQWGSLREWGLMLGLATIPTIIGHSALNHAMRHLRGQVVSLANVGQFIFAGAMGWLLFHEHPSVVFYPASALVLAGMAISIGRPGTPLAPAVPARSP